METSPQSPELCAICETGTDRHIRIQEKIISVPEFKWVDLEEFVITRKNLEIIEKVGLECKLYDKELNIRFMCDGVIAFKNKLYIIEIKTEDGIKFSKREAIEPTHYTQGCIYSLCLNIPDILFIYENRNFLTKKVYHATYTDNDYCNILDDINVVNEAVNNKKLPYAYRDNKCIYCNYKNKCKGE
jgi:CRISPR/Cas system-associated exonuclease Cas4 (RecB family)